MANESYWRRVTGGRVSRRRALGATGAAAAAAAFLAACGGGNTSSSGGATGSGASGSTSSSLLYKPVDTSKQAKSGGVLKHYDTGDIEHFDALIANSFSTVQRGSVFAYNRLLKFKSGIYPNVADGTSEGEMAQSWEISPDKLTVTMKLRQGNGLKWDERSPTNGRLMDMDDVLFSYKKFAKLNPSGANVDHNRNPAAPVSSVTASDPQTLVIKLAKPDATVIGLFSATDHLYIMPKEADGGFDPKQVVRGNGPWQLEEYSPSLRFVWKKNPNYYITGRPFPDRIEIPIITEFAQRLAQFKTGNIYSDIVQRNQEEVIQLKKDEPQTNLYLPHTYPNGLTPSVWFGYEGDSPFKDERVRQAFSMLVDREGFNVAIYNSKAFEDAGLGIEAKTNTCVTAGWGPYWLDPGSKDFGDNAKYLSFNVEEAKKLLSAAGFPNGVDTEVFFNNAGSYGEAYTKSVDVYSNFFTVPGGKIKQSGFPYAQYLDTYYFGYRSGASTRGSGDQAKGYNGFVVEAERPYATAVNLMLGSWHSAGGAFHGLSPDGNNAFKGDSKLDKMIEDIQAEFDQKKQVSLSHDLIRYMTGRSYMIPNPVSSPAYEIWWPIVSGVGWRERWPNNAIWTETAIDWWMDQSKPPAA